MAHKNPATAPLVLWFNGGYVELNYDKLEIKNMFKRSPDLPIQPGKLVYDWIVPGTWIALSSAHFVLREVGLIHSRNMGPAIS